jgi:hypothetical protein
VAEAAAGALVVDVWRPSDWERTHALLTEPQPVVEDST